MWNTNAPPVLSKGRYQITSVFADSGGMGVIYDALDTRCANNRVLIKGTRYDGGTNARHFVYDSSEAVKHIGKLRAILEWEKKVLIRFKKEGINNVPSINDFFFDRSLLLKPQYEGRRGTYDIPDGILGTEPYLVMERMSGQTLEQVIGRTDFQRDAERRLLLIAKEILTIFIRIHKRFEVGGQEAYFIYQDLKPANILVGSADYFTLIDLGGVTLRLGDKTTEPTAGMLTYGYAAPEGETNDGVRIDHRFDLYSLGATLYHGFTRIDPRELPGNFPELDLRELDRVKMNPLTRAVVARALERSPEARYTIAAEMRKDVVNVLREIGELV
jgi:serine/threonine protein kinase